MSNNWLNTIILKDKVERDLFLEKTNSKGIMTRPIWKLMNGLNMYQESQISSLTNSEWLANRAVNIPSSAIMEGNKIL
jgi:perosamine synthetase